MVLIKIKRHHLYNKIQIDQNIVTTPIRAAF
jgi:hypothetical protein